MDLHCTILYFDNVVAEKMCGSKLRGVLDDSLLAHGISNLDEASDVGTTDVVNGSIIVLTVLDTGSMDLDHDVVKALVNFLRVPVDTEGVLRHLEAGGGDSSGVGGLTGGVENLGLLEGLNGAGEARHVGTLRHTQE